MHILVCTVMCGRVPERVRKRVCVRSRKRSRPHISAALLGIQSFPLPSESRREGESSWLSLRCLERQVGQCGSQNLTCARCQRQATATERVLLANLHVELWSLSVTSGNWQAYQFTCIIRIRTLREIIMVKIVRILIEF